MAKAKADTKKKAAPKATKAIKKDKPEPKKAALAKGKKEVLAAATAVPVLTPSSSKASKKEPVAPVKAPALSRNASKASKSSKTLDLLVSEQEMAERKKGWVPNPPRYTTGVLAKFSKLVQGAEKGAVTNI